MDRLSALICVLALAGCEDKAPGGEPAGRVNGAKTTQHQGATTDAFCDVRPAAAAAAPLVWPALTGAAPAPAKTWRWINAWATWCHPCVEEMPRIAKWQGRLAAGGHPVELQFVSVDESDAVVAEFRKANAAIPPTLRLAAPDKVNDWLHQLGLQGEPPIPVHIFVDPQNRVRCVRAGSIGDADYAVVAKLLAE